MALHILDVSIPATTLITLPVAFNFELGEAFLRRVHFDSEGGSSVGFRISHNGLILAPWPGAGLSQWISMVNIFYFTYEEFRRLSGPPYSMTLEAYNTAAAPRRLIALFETAHANYYPVNVMEVKENAVPKIPQPQTPNAAY